LTLTGAPAPRSIRAATRTTVVPERVPMPRNAVIVATTVAIGWHPADRPRPGPRIAVRWYRAGITAGMRRESRSARRRSALPAVSARRASPSRPSSAAGAPPRMASSGVRGRARQEDTGDTGSPRRGDRHARGGPAAGAGAVTRDNGVPLQGIRRVGRSCPGRGVQSGAPCGPRAGFGRGSGVGSCWRWMPPVRGGRWGVRPGRGAGAWQQALTT